VGEWGEGRGGEGRGERVKLMLNLVNSTLVAFHIHCIMVITS